MRLTGFDPAEVLPLLEKLEFRSFIAQVRKLQATLGGIPAQASEARTGSKNGSADDEALWFDFAAHPPPSLPPVRIVDTPEQLERLRQELLACSGIVAWDTETTSLDPRDAQLVGIGCCWSERDVAYLPIGHRQGSNLDWNLVKQAYSPFGRIPVAPKACKTASMISAFFALMASAYKGSNLIPCWLAMCSIQKLATTWLIWQLPI
jgi:DNA polymerase-1